MTDKQAQQIADVAALIETSAAGTTEVLKGLIEQLTKAKTLANHMRWRIDAVAPASAIPTQKQHTDTATKAKGVIYPFIKDVLYGPANAAQYLGIDKEQIIEAIDKGRIYTVVVFDSEVIPQRALDIYRNTAKIMVPEQTNAVAA